MTFISDYMSNLLTKLLPSPYLFFVNPIWVFVMIIKEHIIAIP